MSIPDVDLARARKARGAFFTPPPIADFVVEWAIRRSGDVVLEPSCGEAAFLTAAGRRISSLGGSANAEHLRGVEVHADSAARAAEALAGEGMAAEIEVADFFDIEPTGSFDAVVGNPPYVRYQDHAGSDRAKSRAAALRGGVALTALASSWAAFTVHAAQFLRAGGRLGLVLPAELLSVNYAAGVRQFLFDRFAQVDLVLFTERVFPEVQEEVVLLLASGYRTGQTDHANVYQAADAADLGAIAESSRFSPADPAAKWTTLLMGQDALGAYTEATSRGVTEPLVDWGETTLGMVTGANKFFTLSPERVRTLGLARGDLLALSPPGSRHLRGLDLTRHAWRALGEAGSATYLFRPATDPSPAARAYIAAGERTAIHEAYKCRVRPQWWRVPLLAPADLLLTYMNADTPRLVANSAGVHHLNSVHGVYLAPERRDLGRELLPLASLNSLTMLGAEVVGRSYGGGILKVEPREADVLPVPSWDLVLRVAPSLRDARRAVASLLARGRVREAAAVVDQIVLIDGAAMAPAVVARLHRESARLAARRQSRSGRPA